MSIHNRSIKIVALTIYIETTLTTYCRQWRRSDIKYGGRGQSGQTIILLQPPQKISFTFHF